MINLAPNIPDGTVPLSKLISLTKWTATQPVTKCLELQADGTVKKSSTAAQLYEGTITRLECSPSGLVGILAGIGPNDCLSYAQPADEGAMRIMSRKKHAASGAPADATTRTLDKMAWSNGPSILMGDHDPGGPRRYDRDQLLEALYQCCPAMSHVAQIWVPSTSSCLKNSETGAEVRGVEGQRLYVAVAKGCDIPRAGKVLCQRAWLNGHGHIKISKSGALLVRSIWDEAVFQSNRIDYCAPPICVPPLKSCKPPPQLLGDETLALDTRVAIPDLTPEEHTEYERLVGIAKAVKKPEADIIRAEYRKQMIEEHVVGGLDRETAERVVAMALDGDVLMADFILIAEDGQQVTVGALFADKKRWHGARFADPVEPDYHDDIRIAQAYLTGPGRPYLHSFAHGGKRYRLSRHVQTIRLMQGERATYLDEITTALLSAGVYYRRGGGLVSISNDGRIEKNSSYQVLAVFDEQFRFEKFTKNKLGPADAPHELAKLFGAAYVSRFLNLKAVLTAPCIEPVTGRILKVSGYDLDCEVYVSLLSDDVNIPESPNAEQVNAALALLWWPVRQFPYATPLDESVMLTAMLTAVARALLPTAPAFGFDAPVQGSGKTLLIKVLAALSGSIPAISPQTDARSDDEMRKRIFALLLGGSTSIVIDNIIGEFDSPSLAAMLTSEHYSDRVLKESRTDTVPTNALVQISGNNLILKGDLPRRVLPCRIDPHNELPHQREFTFDPVEFVQHFRQELVVAALTLFKGYRAAKTDKRVGSGRTASFEVWDDLVRQTVCWLKYQQECGALPTGKVDNDTSYPCLRDPMEAINDAVKADPSRSQLGRLLNTWAVEIGTGNSRGTAITVKVLINRVGPAAHPQISPGSDYDTDDQSLRDILMELAGNPARGEINSRSLGKVLSKHKDRITDGLCLRAGELRQGALTWWVENVSSEFGEIREFVSTDARMNVKNISIQAKENKLTKLTKLTEKPRTAPTPIGRAKVRLQ